MLNNYRKLSLVKINQDDKHNIFFRHCYYILLLGVIVQCFSYKINIKRIVFVHFVGKHTMKTAYILLFGILLLLVSCGQPKPTNIDFDGQTFELPIKVMDAKRMLGLQYECYSGFYKGSANDITIATQLENYPVFMGSDNDTEERYYQCYIVGITFYKKNETLEHLIKSLEKQYDKKFNTETKNLDEKRTLPPFKMTYHYIITNEGLFVALKEIERKYDTNKYVSISFYKGISNSDLGEYLEYINWEKYVC